MRFSDYLHQKASRNKIPLGGTFELSPVCNFSCRMCYVRKTPDQVEKEGKRIRDWNEWLELAKRCREDGMLYLLLTGGEPFVYPHFRELYTELHRMGLIISINTNGSMIDRETVDWLKTIAPSRMNITLYGTSRETYGRICGNPDAYDRSIEAIRMLKEAGIPMVINASMIPENADDMESILAIGRELGINVRMATYMFPPVRREQEQSDSRFSAEEAADMFLRRQRCQMGEKAYEKWMADTVQGLNKKSTGSGDDWGSCEEFMSCRAGRSTFWVSWDGGMYACGMMPFPIEEKPFERDFKECWQELTEQVRSIPALSECAGCPKKELCKPCAAMLYAETGDVNRRAEYLCRMSECIAQKLAR